MHHFRYPKPRGRLLQPAPYHSGQPAGPLVLLTLELSCGCSHLSAFCGIPQRCVPSCDSTCNRSSFSMDSPEKYVHFYRKGSIGLRMGVQLGTLCCIVSHFSKFVASYPLTNSPALVAPAFCFDKPESNSAVARRLSLTVPCNQQTSSPSLFHSLLIFSVLTFFLFS